MTNGTMISIDTAEKLYWFGRYVQRAQTITKEMVNAYDFIIDRDFEEGRKLFAKLGIGIDYTNARDFLYQGVFGEHPGNIASIIANARENAICIRHLLDERGFATLNTIYNRLVSHQDKEVTPYMLEEFIDDFALILGIFSSELGRPKAYQLIRLGQQIERFDLILRLYEGIDLVNAELETMNAIARRLNRHYYPITLTSSDMGKVLEKVNSVICDVIVKK